MKRSHIAGHKVRVSGRRGILLLGISALLFAPGAFVLAQESSPPPAATETAGTPAPVESEAVAPPTDPAVPSAEMQVSASLPPADPNAAGSFSLGSGESGEAAAANVALVGSLDDAMKKSALIRSIDKQPEEVGTLFFTLWQHTLLQDAKRMFRTRRPDAGELSQSPGDPEAPRPKGLRELSLSGILYKGSENWVVWMNGQRIAPNAIPKEVIDIKVARSHIDLKWYDAYTNLVYPIRLRPHQRFNLDSRIFLPGATVEN